MTDGAGATPRHRHGLPARACRWLLDRGLVEPAAVHRYGLVARDVSQSNGVALIELGDGRGFAVKDVGPLDDVTQGSPAQELRLYQLVADDAQLPALPPRFVDHDPQQHLLALEALVRHRRLDQLPARRQVLDEALAAGIGQALGRWHASTQSLAAAVPEAFPWVLHLDGDQRLRVLDEPPYANVVQRVLDDPVLAGLAARGRAAWTPDVLMHGDVRFANLLVTVSPVEVHLVDWEMSGRGDHRWDVAGVAQEYLARGELAEVGGGRPGRAWRAVEAFRAAHGTAFASTDTWEELAPFVAARLVVRAVQLAAWEGAGEQELDHHLALARRVLEP